MGPAGHPSLSHQRPGLSLLFQVLAQGWETTCVNGVALRSQGVVQDEGLLVSASDRQEKGSWLEWALCSGRMATCLDIRVQGTDREATVQGMHLVE